MSKKLEVVTESQSKSYYSPHENYILALGSGTDKKKFKFEGGLLNVTDPDDAALIDKEYERRYRVGTDASGEPLYGRDMKFIPMDSYQKSRLKESVQVKVNGTIYKVTEADLIEMVKAKEGLGPEGSEEKVIPTPPEKTPKPRKTGKGKSTGKIQF